MPLTVITVDVDIQKPDETGYLSVIERPTSTKASGTTSRQLSTGSQSPEFEGYTEPLSEGEDEEMNVAPAKNEGQRTGLSGAAYEEAVAFREKMLKHRQEEGEQPVVANVNGKNSTNGGLAVPLEDADEREEGSSTGGRPRHKKWYSFGGSEFRSRALSINPLAPSSAFDETLKTKLHETQEAQNKVKDTREESTEDDDETEAGDLSGAPSGDDRIMVRDWHAPAGKRISVPVRIEPKVYFAAERTFLVSNLNFSFFINVIIHLLTRTLSCSIVEMAEYLSFHWYHRNDASQFRPCRRSKGTHQRRVFHVCSITCHCLFRRNFRLPIA